jgi:hypothetical protein
MHPPVNLHPPKPRKPAPLPRPRKPAVRYLVFGVPYMIFFGLLSLYWLGLSLFALIEGTGSRAVQGMVFFAGIAFAQFLYTAMAGFQCYRGRVSGVWMGVVHVVTISLFMLATILIVMGSPAGPDYSKLIAWAILVVMAVLAGLAVADLRKHSKRKALIKAGSAPGQFTRSKTYS